MSSPHHQRVTRDRRRRAVPGILAGLFLAIDHVRSVKEGPSRLPALVPDGQPAPEPLVAAAAAQARPRVVERYR